MSDAVALPSVADFVAARPELAGLESFATGIYLVGSHTRGWANSSSDYDYAVITPDTTHWPVTQAVAIPSEPAWMGVMELVAGGKPCELAFWTEGQVAHALERVSMQVYESGEASLRPLAETEETLLERFATAQPLIGEDWLAATRGRLAGSAFRAFLTTFSLSSADGKLIDVDGMLKGGDLESAFLAAELAIDHMIDAYLDSRENFGSRIPKWRMRRLREQPGAEAVTQRYWALKTRDVLTTSGTEGWIAACVDLCQDLALEIEI